MKSLKIKNWNILFILTLLIFTSCSTPKRENSIVAVPQYQKTIAESLVIIQNYLLTTFTPGASVSVSIDGQTVWSQGLGYASKELKVLAKRETKFRIGQTAQLFTSYIMMQLQQNGALNLDSSFHIYIPKFPKYDYDFTPKMLGAQTAGFPPTSNKEFYGLKVGSLKKYIELHTSDKMVYQPETYYEKSDYSIALLGLLAEEITQQNYAKLLKEYVLDTLKLSNTCIDYPQIITENRSSSYDLDFIARLANAPMTNLSALAPVNGLLSTADDLNTAAQALIEPGLLTAESIDFLCEQHNLAIGGAINRSFCWFAFKDKMSRKVVGQTGSTIGGASVVVVYPEQKLVVTICANLKDEMNEMPAVAIANKFLESIDPK